MQNADKITLEYYREHAHEVFARYESVEQSGVAKYFTSSFAAGSRVLDVGAGSGRDLQNLLKLGFDAYGVEPVEALRHLAIEAHPTLKNRLFAGRLPDCLSSYEKYDGVVCSAVLMHIPHAQLYEALAALVDVLKERGRLLISIPASRPDVQESHRDPSGRLFTPISPDQLKQLGNDLELKCIEEHISDDALGRSGTRWHTLLFQRR